MIDFDSKPDFVNDEGVKWWLDKNLTEYARRADAAGISLDLYCFAVKRPDGYRTRLLVTADREILMDNQATEAIGCRIDIMKFMAREETSVETTATCPIPVERLVDHVPKIQSRLDYARFQAEYGVNEDEWLQDNAQEAATLLNEWWQSLEELQRRQWLRRYRDETLNEIARLRLVVQALDQAIQ